MSERANPALAAAPTAPRSSLRHLIPVELVEDFPTPQAMASPLRQPLLVGSFPRLTEDRLRYALAHAQGLSEDTRITPNRARPDHVLGQGSVGR